MKRAWWKGGISFCCRWSAGIAEEAEITVVTKRRWGCRGGLVSADWVRGEWRLYSGLFPGWFISLQSGKLFPCRNKLSRIWGYLCQFCFFPPTCSFYITSLVWWGFGGFFVVWFFCLCVCCDLFTGSIDSSSKIQHFWPQNTTFQPRNGFSFSEKNLCLGTTHILWTSFLIIKSPTCTQKIILMDRLWTVSLGTSSL